MRLLFFILLLSLSSAYAERKANEENYLIPLQHDIHHKDETSVLTHQVIEPEMVLIQGGTFQMGCVSGKDCDDDERVHRVSINDFYMAKTEVTVKEYMNCVKANICQPPQWLEEDSDYNTHTGSYDFYRQWEKILTGDNYPIVGVSWNNATDYAQWLTKQTGKDYRLPTEAEWEYAARAGSKTKYPWGNTIGKNKANCDCSDKFEYTAPVASFNAYNNLYDMNGNIWEWTCSAYPKNNQYNGLESKCANNNDSRSRVMRGGSWGDKPRSVRSATRSRDAAMARYYSVGFRLSRTR